MAGRSGDPMKRAICIGIAVAAVTTAVLGQVRPESPGPEQARKTLDTYCVGCHNSRAKAGGVALDTLPPRRGPRARRRLGSSRAQAARPADAAARQPPAGSARDRRVRDVDGGAARSRAAGGPVAGHVPMQRLTRTEFGDGGQRSARHRARRRAAAAGRDRSRRLRQHRRGAERLAGVPRSVRRRRAARGAAGGRRIRAQGRRAPTIAQPKAAISRRTSTACRSARAAG